MCCAPPPPLCGQRISNKLNEFPSAVGIMKTLNIKRIKYFLCGGTLIHKEVVLTTAHCVDDYRMSELEIQAGLWGMPKMALSSQLKIQNRKLRKIILHEDFNRATHQNNIALLVLDRAFEMNSFVGVSCPPTPEYDYDSKNCVVFRNEESLDAGRVVGNIEIDEHDVCERKLRRTKLGDDFILHESFLCAIGRNGEDTCEGDGGKGLLCSVKGTDNMYALVGLVSWGVEGCKNRNVPGVYVSVKYFYEWIDKKLIENGVENEY